MSIPSWTDSLRKILQSLPSKPGKTRLALVGIGNELRGDDAIGVVILRALQSAITGHENILFVDAGSAPENFTGPLRGFSPGLVLLLDAADLGEPPGAIRCVDWQETSGFSASSHTLPLSILGEYLSTELGCEVALLGIQPAGNDLGAPLSPAAVQAVDASVNGLIDLLFTSTGNPL